METQFRAVQLLRVWKANICYGGNNFRANTKAPCSLVSRHLVGFEPKERSERFGAATISWDRNLQDSWTWLHKLRRAMVRPGQDRLSGTIQVDETYVGGKKRGKRGRGAEGKVLVLILVEKQGRKAGRIRLRCIKDASAKTLSAAIKENVDKGSHIETDGWSGYNELSNIGFDHEKLRPEGVIGEDLLPLCHRQAALLKRWLLGTHQGAVSHSHLDYYLDKYTFRFNRLVNDNYKVTSTTITLTG